MKKKTDVLLIVMSVVLALYAISILAPMAWTVITSLKTRSDFVENVFGLPEEWEFSNYLLAYDNFYAKIATQNGTETIFIEEMLLNSLLYAVGCALFNVTMECFAGYTIAKCSNWRISKIIYAFVFVAMSLPIVGSLPSELQIAKSLGLYDKIYGLWFMKTHFISVYFLVFVAFFKSIPQSFDEAARIDGANNFTIFSKIMLPLSGGMFFTVFLIKFIGFWNDYQTPLVFMPSKPTMALGLFYYSTSFDNVLTSVPQKLAGCVIVMLPTLIIYLIFHNKLLSNISIGSGVKG